MSLYFVLQCISLYESDAGGSGYLNGGGSNQDLDNNG